MTNNNIESLKKYITDEIEKRGLENSQIEIDFTDLFEDFSEIENAAQELGYEVEKGEGFGVYWIYK